MNHLPAIVRDVNPRYTDILTEEPVLPEQVFGRAVAVTGEERMLMALLMQAFDDVRLPRVRQYRPGKDSKPRDLRAEALAWIESNARHTTSFLAICEHFGLDAAAVRREVLRGRGGARRSHRNREAA